MSATSSVEDHCTIDEVSKFKRNSWGIDPKKDYIEQYILWAAGKSWRHLKRQEYGLHCSR